MTPSTRRLSSRARPGGAGPWRSGGWPARTSGAEPRRRLCQTRPMPTGLSRPRRPDRWDVALVGYALVAALCRPLTAAAVVAVLIPGVVLAAIAVARTPRPST